MKATPQITADLEDYPELATLVRQSVRRVAELMELHDISDLRRIRKTGVFGRPYAKDTVKAIGIKSVPASIAASRQTVGKILLDYLETVGIGGLSLEFGEEDAATLAALWSPQGCRIQPKPVAPQPKPAVAKPQANAVPANPIIPPGTPVGPVPAANTTKLQEPTKTGGKDKAHTTNGRASH